MCGIVGFVGKKDVADYILDSLEKLEYRGYDSAGVSVLNKGKIETEKTVERIRLLKSNVKNSKTLKGQIGIGHTRWATHGRPTIANAHPHLSDNGKFAVVHNGIIENYISLKKELEADGVKFQSQTDTEVIAHLLQKYYTGDLKTTVNSVVKKLKGTFALGIICTDSPDTLIAVKNFSPIIIGLSENQNIIASDITAIVPYTKNVIYIEDGDIAYIEPCSVEIYNSEGLMMNRKISVIDWDIEESKKNGYEHFMMKEIMEQPKAVLNTLAGRICEDEIIFENFRLDSIRLKEINKIQIIACGSAYHAGVVGKYVFEELLRITTETELASEYRYRNPIVDSNTLVIAISQSGETADTLSALKEAKKRGAYTLSIVNVVGSSIAKLSDDVIYTKAGPEIAVATTKGYSTQLAVIYMLAIWAAEKLGSTETKHLKSLKSGIKALPELIERVILEGEKVKQLALDSKSRQSIFFIGRNIDYAVALEASLKLKEISYIHSESYAAGELKHGAISLVEEGTLVVALCANSVLEEKMLSNIKEVKARGGKILACVEKGNFSIAKEVDNIIYIPKTDPLLAASLEIIPFQFYSYFIALYNGCDIDKPRNLAKSVTVE